MREARGSATIWMLTLCGVIGAVAAAGVLLGLAVEARHRAESSADLAALAGASALARGQPAEAACARSAAVLDAAHGSLARCAVHGDEVDVEVAVPLPPALRRWAGTAEVRARARAGPVAVTGAPRWDISGRDRVNRGSRRPPA